MSNLRDILRAYVTNGSVPGAVGLVARGERAEVQALGSADVDVTSPIVRDSIFRIASLTKPITAAAAMMLVAVQHLLRHPGRADRPGFRAPVARVPG